MDVEATTDQGHDRPPGPTALGRMRFTRWDGRQRLVDLEADEILDALTDDLLAESDLAAAVHRLLSRGIGPREGITGDGLAGIDDLLARLAQQKQELLARHRLGDVLEDVREELHAIVEIERRGIDRRIAEAAGDPELRRLAAELVARHAQRLDALPEDLGGRIAALQDHDFLEPTARDRFGALLDRLRSTVLDGLLGGLADAVRDATPEQLAANRDMARELDELLRRRLADDEPTAEEVGAFLARHPGVFPGATDLDDILSQLAGRMAAMQSLLRSMSRAQREELSALMAGLLRDEGLRGDLARLAATLDAVLPDGLGERYRFGGEQDLTLEGALAQLGRLGDIDRLAEALAAGADPGALPDVDLDEVRRLLGEDAARDVTGLRDLVDRLRDAGYLDGEGDRLELTARGTRRLGQGVLEQLFGRLDRGALGGHVLHRTGRAGERSEQSVPWDFGRPFQLDLQATLRAAMARPSPGPSGRGVRLIPADFVVHASEDATDAATVLLLDMSRSMLLRGCFLAAKKVAIALDTLIRTRYPRDTLHVVGFAYHARPVRPGALATLSWHGYEYGTNLQHGLQVARGLLARSHAASRSIVVITDGEPTAHLEDGGVEFAYPPTRRTIEETIKEVARCTREGITINTFMLERSRALAAFVDRMTRLNRGRAFYADPEDLGSTVLVDYLGRRTGRA